MTTGADKLLVVGPAWVGDMLMSQVLYRHLHDTRPGLVIDVLATAWSEPLLARMPEVNRSIVMPLGHGELGLGQRRRLGRGLREQNYGQAIVLPNSFKSALVPWFANIQRRTGWRGEMRYGLLNDLRVLDEQAMPMMAQRYLALGLAAGEPALDDLPMPRLDSDRARGESLARRHALAPNRRLLALCPGAEFGAAKRWPAAHFARVAMHFAALGWQPVLFGSAGDRPACEQVAQLAGGAACNLAGHTQLDEAVDLLALCDAVVSNDSGLMHVAAALSVPVVAVYGPTSPGFTPPLGERTATMQLGLDCSPCFARDCPLGHHRCMQDLSPQRVIATLEPLLSDRGGAP